MLRGCRVPNAKPGRDGLDIDVYGMEGVPEDVLGPDAGSEMAGFGLFCHGAAADNLLCPAARLAAAPEPVEADEDEKGGDGTAAPAHPSGFAPMPAALQAQLGVRPMPQAGPYAISAVPWPAVRVSLV
jgi:hypothetical protein